MTVLKENNCEKYKGKVVYKEGKAYCEIPKITQTLIRDITKSIPLDEFGKVYRDGIDDCMSENALRIQAQYILCNIDLPETDNEKLAKIQLKAIHDNQLIPLQLETVEERKWVMDEIELGEIMTAFENATEGKVNKGKVIELGDFNTFAKKHNIPVEKVIVATDWIEENLSKEVQELKKKYTEKMHIKWG